MRSFLYRHSVQFTDVTSLRCFSVI